MINGHLRIRLAPFSREQMDHIPNIDTVGEGHIPHLGMAVAELRDLPGVIGFGLTKMDDESLHLTVSSRSDTDDAVRETIYRVIRRLQHRTEISCPTCGTRRHHVPCPTCGRPDARPTAGATTSHHPSPSPDDTAAAPGSYP